MPVESLIQFKRVYGRTTIIVQLSGDATIPELEAAFEGFLDACGYVRPPETG